MSSLPIRFFDRTDEHFVLERRRLPHWTQEGTLCFITFRTWDSLPQPVIDAWLHERAQWLLRHEIDVQSPSWREQLEQLPAADQHDFHRVISERWESSLDECHGQCVLRRPELAKIVADSLHYFDDDRYILTDYTVMPNHLHLLAAFPDSERMLAQCESWKHYTACKINRELGRKGRFWMVDGFDHLVRSREQFRYLRGYCKDNPRRANLRDGEYLHYSSPRFRV